MYMYVQLYSLCVRICTRTSMYVYAETCAYEYVCLIVYVYNMYTCVCICNYWMCVFVYAHMHAYTPGPKCQHSFHSH